ncbi:MAG: hypothetical protein QOH48_264 [Actinomycetota bacterium]|nr:hypothetical protein [Actinomycetota bacterium]
MVGTLFLTSTAAFMTGSRLIASHFSGDRRGSSLLTGVLLEGYCGLAVAGIGVTMLPLLNPYDVRLARAYAGLRILELLAIGLVGGYMVARKRQFPNYDAFIYVFTATGGIILSYLLYVSKLVPRPLAQLGLVGYSLLALGIPVTLISPIQLDAGWGMAFIVPGGVFERMLPLLLIAKGFSLENGGAS